LDCLHGRGRGVLREALAARRAELEKAVREGPRLQLARRVADDGFQAFAVAKRRGLEGVIGKDPSSRYEPGVRSPAWCKVKVRAEEEFVIGGFTAPRGSRQHIGALLVGAWDGDGLRYAGKVGTGFTDAVLAALHRRLSPRASSPFVDAPRFRDVTWVEPALVAQLGFTEKTSDGKLRHPVYLGLREDKAPRDVRWTLRGEAVALSHAAEARVRGRTAKGEGLGGGASSAPSRGKPRRRISGGPAPAPAGATRTRRARSAPASRPRRRGRGP